MVSFLGTLVMAIVAFLSSASASWTAPDDVAVQVAFASRSIQPGEVVRIDVSCACAAPNASATVTAFGKSIPLVRTSDPTMWQGLVGIDLDTRPGTYRAAITVKQPARPPLEAERQLLVKPKAFATRRLRVPPDFVDPPPAALERINREAKRLEAIFKTVSPAAWTGPFVAPMTIPAIANFGSRSVFNGQPRSPHAGVDFPSPSGTPIRSPGAGTVVLAEDLFFTGNTLVIDHGYGLYSLLAHLSAFAVKAGDHVEREQLVGRVGATGRVTGPHLHWTMRLNDARVDPLALLAVSKSQG